MVGYLVRGPVCLLLASIALSVASPTNGKNNKQVSNHANTCASNSSQVNTEVDFWPWQSYKTSNATPPTFVANRTNQELASGLLFIGYEAIVPNKGVKVQTPLIMSDTGDLVWQGPNGTSSNFRQGTLYNKPVITYWTGDGEAANSQAASHGYGKVLIYNQNYEVIHEVCPKLKLTTPPGTSITCGADVHESYITERNTMLVTAYNITTADLSSVGGPKNGWVQDSLVVEVDIETNEVVFSWSPLAHVPINATHVPLDVNSGLGVNASTAFDYFHTNAAQSFGDYYLINSRHTWSTYLVDKKGSIVWELNGATGGDFGTIPKGGNFVSFSAEISGYKVLIIQKQAWQHFARLIPISAKKALYHVFSNNNYTPLNATTASTGVTLLLDFPPNKACPPKLLTSLVDPVAPVNSFAGGSHDILANGNHLLGYGIDPFIKEFGPTGSGNGDVRLSIQFGYASLADGAQTYRIYRTEWHATPSAYAPSLVVAAANTTTDALEDCAAGSEIRGYVSWNGATDVEGWNVYAGSSAKALKKVGMVGRMGFETQFVVPAGSKYVQVGAVMGPRAVSGKGERKSAVVAVA